ncbi:MAG TPA: hypothetical protein VGJ28_17870 [Micromonosporaceae bacterium]
MGSRYQQIAIVAAVIFLIGAVAALLSSGPLTTSSGQTNAGLIALGLIGLVMCVVSYVWAVRNPLHRVVPDLGLVIVFAGVASILLLPMIGEITAPGKYEWSGANPFSGGAGLFFDKIWFFLGCTLVGATIGWLISIAFGRDYRSKALKNYSSTVLAKPRKIVRR